MNDDNNKEIVPIWVKPALTIEEAALYSNIGRAKLRELAKSPVCDISFNIGTKVLIKRKKLDEYIYNAIEI